MTQKQDIALESIELLQETLMSLQGWKARCPVEYKRMADNSIRKVRKEIKFWSKLI